MAGLPQAANPKIKPQLMHFTTDEGNMPAESSESLTIKIDYEMSFLKKYFFDLNISIGDINIYIYFFPLKGIELAKYILTMKFSP